MHAQQAKDPLRVARSRVAVASRRGGHPAALAQARRELAAAKLERAIREALAATPALTTERRAELAELLAGGESA